MLAAERVQATPQAAGLAGQAWCFTLRASPDSDLFRGHFPDLPVLPGVAQLQWALALWRRYSGDSRPLRGLRRLKFQRVVVPGDQLRLECRADGDQHMTFVFRRQNTSGSFEAVSSGQCLLAGSSSDASTHA